MTLYRRRIPLGADTTDIDRENVGALHTELSADIRELVSRGPLPRDLMAIIVVDPDGNREWLAERLKHAGIDDEISLEPDSAPVVVLHRHSARRAFAGTPVEEFFATTAGDRFAIVYGLPGGRWFCADPPELPEARGQA